VVGSLPKYLLGNNLEIFTRRSTEFAIEKLSDELHLPIKNATVTVLHIAANLIMTEPVKSYLMCLGEAKNYKKNIYESGLIYCNKLRAVEFYDKIEEMREKKVLIESNYMNKNILRYELKIQRRIGRQMKSHPVNASMLYDEYFFSQVNRKWEEEYFKIKKISKLKFNGLSEMRSVKNLEAQLALIGLKTIGGEQDVINELKIEEERLKKKGKFDAKAKTDFHRLKSKIRNLANTPALTEPNECISELDEKIKQAAIILRD